MGRVCRQFWVEVGSGDQVGFQVPILIPELLRFASESKKGRLPPRSGLLGETAFE